MTLLVLTLAVWSGAHAPAPVVEASPRRQAHEARMPPPRLPPKQIEWLEHAIDHILGAD